MRLLHVVGTRPNFVKMAPVIAALRRADPDGCHVLVHTGPALRPDDVGHLPRAARRPGARSHARRRLGDACRAARRRFSRRSRRCSRPSEPDLVIVPGDVNSTLAAALAAAHLRIPIAHVEAGLRSYDRTMPEEVNRVLTDQVSDLLFTHSPEAEANLAAEGIDADRGSRLVGNTMIDSLVALEGEFRDRRAGRAIGARARLLPARHAAPSGARRRAAPARRRSSASPRSPQRCRCSSPFTRVPGPRSARRRETPAGAAADRPGRISRLPLAGGRCRAPC